MKVMFVVNGFGGSDDESGEASRYAGWEAEEPPAAEQTEGEVVSATFVMKGTRAQIAGTARALNAFAGRLRQRATPEGIPYDFDVPAVAAGDWGS
jgi:hypothetical protein